MKWGAFAFVGLGPRILASSAADANAFIFSFLPWRRNGQQCSKERKKKGETDNKDNRTTCRGGHWSGHVPSQHRSIVLVRAHPCQWILREPRAGLDARRKSSANKTLDDTTSGLSSCLSFRLFTSIIRHSGRKKRRWRNGKRGASATSVLERDAMARTKTESIWQRRNESIRSFSLYWVTAVGIKLRDLVFSSS